MLGTDQIDAENGIQNTSMTSVLNEVFGAISDDYDDFVESISGAENISPTAVHEIYSATGGRRRIGAQIFEAARALDLRLDETDSSRLMAITRRLPPVPPHWPIESVAALGLLELLSNLPSNNDIAIQLAVAALPSYLNVNPELLPAEDDLIAELVLERLLSISPAAPHAFSVPLLIGSLMRRGITLADSTPGAARVALTKSLEQNLTTILHSQNGDVSAVLSTARSLEAWSVLGALWSSQYVNLFVTALRVTVDTYLTLPEDVLDAHPALSDAHDFAVRADSLMRVSNTDDPLIIVPRLLSAQPTESRPAQLTDDSDTSDFSPDESAIWLLRATRLNRSRGTFAQALKHLESDTRVTTMETCAPVLRAALDYEHALCLGKVGHFSDSIEMLNRCIRTIESTVSDLVFPLQGAHALAAQTSLLLGLHREADGHLAHVQTLERRTGLMPDSVRYAMTTTELYRRLDELDVQSSAALLERARLESGGDDSAAALFLAEGLHEVYSGRASLAAKSMIERHMTQRPWAQDPTLLRDSSRLNILSFVCLAAGEKKPIQQLLTELKPTSPGFALAKARLSIALGQADEALRMVPRILADEAGPRIKACGYALRAASLLMVDRADEAVQAFVTSLEYCAVASTLMPVAQLPREIRRRLVNETVEADVWTRIAHSFTDRGLTAATIQRRLTDVPETLVTLSIESQANSLSTRELSLLFALESGHSITKIAHDSGMVGGTVKNRLSGLYKRLGVRNRNQAIAYARDHGYLSSGN